MNLTPSTFWALTPFEFMMLVKGYEEREKLDALKRAELIAEIYNASGNAKRRITVRDFLPWADEYRSGNGEGLAHYEKGDSPALTAVKELLAAQGHDPESMDRKSDEWQAAEREVLRIMAPCKVRIPTPENPAPIKVQFPEDW